MTEAQEEICWNIAEWFGWTKLYKVRCDSWVVLGVNPNGHLRCVPDYFTDKSAALELLEKISGSAGIYLTIGDSGLPHFSIHGDKDSEWYSSEGKTWMEAVCIAWKKWRNGESDE